MKRRPIEAYIVFFCGLICIAAGLYIYFVANTIYPNSGSSRVQDLNWLLQKFGKTGTAILISILGIIAIFWGAKKMGKK